jgi:hypothetical protein
MVPLKEIPMAFRTVTQIGLIGSTTLMATQTGARMEIPMASRTVIQKAIQMALRMAP